MLNQTRNFVAIALVALSVSPELATAGGNCSAEKKQASTEGATAQFASTAGQGDPLAIFPLAEAAGFKTLTAAVKAAGLQETLTVKGPFTVFAPTDEAFAKLPAGTVEGLLANPEKLKKVLLHHVVAGDVRAADVMKIKSAKSLNGTSLAIGTKDGVTVAGAKVVKADIVASNGVVHVIDTVLIPGDL
ncbi:MAG: fasciclin domain-containing protein [bacterium]|nr:fasciclin domain-containing protein [bacterium]